MKAKTIALVLLLLITNFSHGQVKFRVKKLNADSLVELIPEKDGSELVDALNILSNVICRKDIDSSINLATRAIELSEKLEYQKGLADGYFNVGNGYFLLDSLQPTISNYLKALRIYEDLEPSEEFGNLCMQLFIINTFTGRNEAALHYANEAKNAYENIDDKPGQAMANWVCGIEGYMGEWEKGIEYSKKALTFLDPERYQNEVAFIYNSMGEVYLNAYYQTRDTSYLNTALYWCFKAFRLKKINDDVKTVLYFNMASIYVAFNTAKAISTAVDYLHKANLTSDSSYDAYDWKPTIFRILGEISNHQGDYEGSIHYFKLGIKIIDERLSNFSINAYREPILGLNFKRFHRTNKQEMNKGLHDAYVELVDYKKALEHYTQSMEAQGETYKEKFENKITMMEADSKEEKSEKQMVLLARDNEVKALTIRQSRIIIYGIVGILIVVILFGFLFLRQNKLKNEHKTVLLEQKLLRLQMNPHFIFNALSNILNFVNRKDTENAANYLSSFSRLLRSTLESSREDFILLEEEINSLRNYLDLQLLRYSGKFDYSIEVDSKLDIENSIIPPMLIQPFIENAIEHGIRHKHDKGQINVRFRLDNNKVICEVEDDGVGREKAWEAEVQKQKTHKSLATEIITDRIHSLNRKLKQSIKLSIIDLKNEKNDASGTRVVLDIPYLID